MTPGQIRAAGEVLAKIEQLNRAIKALQDHNDKQYVIEFKLVNSRSLDDFAPSTITIDCINLTQQIAFLAQQRDAYLKEAQAIGVDCRGLANVR